MAYNKTVWQDHVVDNHTGQIIQQGTPVSATRLNNIEKGIEDAHKQLDSQEKQTATIKHGVNIVTPDKASGATVQVKGRTLVNILGNDGGCESLTNWFKAGTPELSTLVKRSGNSSFKFSASGATCYVSKDFNNKLDVNKQYVLGAWIYVESFTRGLPMVGLYEPGSLTTSRYALYTTSANVGGWQFAYVKIPAANTLVGNGFRLLIGLASTTEGQPTAVVYIDDVRLYEVSAADYAAIGTTILGDAVDAYLPYVDGLKRLKGVGVRKTGKNLLPPATLASRVRSVWTVGGPYKAIQNRTGASQTMDFDISLKPGTYTISFKTDIDMKHYVTSFDTNGVETTIYQPTGVNPLTFIVPQNSAYVSVRFGNNYNGIFTVENWMLVHGGVDKLPDSFEPRVDQYAHCPVTLGSNVDRSIADSYDSTTGQVFRRWKTGVKLDGSLSWLGAWNVSENPVIKRISITNFPNIMVGMPGHIFHRYDGLIFPEGSTAEGTENIFMAHSNGTFYINVRMSDVGWVESVNANANAVKAMMNGWKANGNNGSVYNSWVSILTGVAPPTNTEAYVAANKAPGWDAWATLDYVLAMPVTEELSGDLGSISLDARENSVELLEGTIVREKANPVRGTGTSSRNEYYINLNQVTTPSFEVPSGSQLTHRAAIIIAIYDGEKRNAKWSIAVSSNAHGKVRASINVEDLLNPDNVYVDYVVLDKYSFSTNAIEAVLHYKAATNSILAQAVQEIAQIKTHDGIQDWILAQYAARLLALEEA
ncbi:hypothetical protein [Paenibacillus sp. NPDC057967]|uniref:hypothetical protein n=1 Tax=Paenibacillus sp. NPDC057967 TaxID=3346293 RepID=UPI0036D95FE1